MSILEVSNVSKSFGGVKANVDISMNVEKGKIVGLIGPNGSGKTLSRPWHAPASMTAALQLRAIAARQPDFWLWSVTDNPRLMSTVQDGHHKAGDSGTIMKPLCGPVRFPLRHAVDYRISTALSRPRTGRLLGQAAEDFAFRQCLFQFINLCLGKGGVFLYLHQL